MKQLKTIQLICIIAVLLISCNNKDDQKLPTVNVGGIELPDLDPDLLVPVDVKLSQIADNIRVVTLETSSESMLSTDAYFLIGDIYIIAFDRAGIYQFSIDGTFIRKLANIGRGPGEIPYARPKSTLVEDEDMLVAFDTDKIYMYELSTGNFLGDDKRLLLDADQNLSNARYIGDSLLLFSYEQSGTMTEDISEDSTGCGIKIQSLSGIILWEKKFDYRSWVIYSMLNMKVLDGSNINILSTNNPEEFILQVYDQDTIYKLNTETFSIEPTLIRHIEKQMIEGYPVNLRVDNCIIEYDEFARVNGYQLMNFTYLMDVQSKLGFRYLILYDDNNNTASRIGTFFNDHLGFHHETSNDIGSNHNLPFLIEPSRKLVEIYDAFTFSQNAEESLLNTDLDASVKTRLLELKGKISETDNPVLVIGDIKKKIDL